MSKTVRWACLAGVLAATGCPPPPMNSDGGSDAGPIDSGSADAGTQDSGSPDSGLLCPGDAGRDDAGAYTLLSVVNDLGSTMGIFDPSLLYPPDSGVGVLTYSSVPDQAHIHTRVAVSADAGGTWIYFGDVNQAQAVTVTTSDPSVCDAGSCTGTLVHEVSSVTIDPTDPDGGRLFKVFTHTYFVAATASGPKLVYPYGYISMYTSALSGPNAPWTEEKILGWSSSSPLSTQGVAQNVNTDPTLASAMSKCVGLSEPGVLSVSRPGIIDLALTCIYPEPGVGFPIEIELLRSTDHGASWRWVSTLVTAQDAAALGAHGPGGPQASAPDLFAANGDVYLLMTPNGDINGGGNGYRGCLALKVTDLDAGTIERCGGAPVVQSAYLGLDGVFTGACTAAVGSTATGVLVPMADLSQPPAFKIFASHQGPP